MMTTGPTGSTAGTFRAAGCVSFQPGTVRAFGDRNPVPDGVERPRPHRNVPIRDDMSPPATTCPRTRGVHPPAGLRDGNIPRPGVARPTPTHH